MHRASSLALTISLILCSIFVGAEDHKTRVEHSKPLPRGKGLGTQFYTPTANEKDATKEWTKDEQESGSPETETLKGQLGRRVAWFGIVREVREDKEKKETRLLVEMKYFDGFTDAHLQIVSIFGAGDFRVVIPETGHKLKKLSLVRIYGKTTTEEAGLPVVSADFVRHWDWGLFAFMPYGKDKSKPEWVKLRKVDPDDIYNSEPDQEYYEERLGKR